MPPDSAPCHMLPQRVCACRSWHNHLNPDIRKTPWTEEEDRIILEKHEVLGNQWAKIAEYLPGRCVLSCCMSMLARVCVCVYVWVCVWLGGWVVWMWVCFCARVRGFACVCARACADVRVRAPALTCVCARLRFACVCARLR
jgi:hypothetical protein